MRQDHYEAQFLRWANTVWQYNRCKIHRYVAALFSHDIVCTSYNTYCIFSITNTTLGANWMIQLFLLWCIRIRDLPISRILYISLPVFFPHLFYTYWKNERFMNWLLTKFSSSISQISNMKKSLWLRWVAKLVARVIARRAL